MKVFIMWQTISLKLWPKDNFGMDTDIDFYWVSRQSAKSTTSGQNITKVSKQTKIAHWNDSNWPKRQFTGKKMVVTKSIA